MREQDLAPVAVPESATQPAAETDDPWHGIPAELLDGKQPYDTDSTGGCG
ncbi:MAG TPA: hypothetical protein VFR67_21820 [Pilimelia sp.]|nr:hypothetical protein [Pilimelia sp.]